ncbi:MAG: SRPBCC domain-containing protein [Pseudohongiellaceae bacterium]|nr:SRPBCC domain-containing protein [Pseudohongiellaceae bacterium]
MKSYTVEKSIIIYAPRQRIYRALTSSQEIPKFYPLIQVESTWREGDSVKFIGELDGVGFIDYGILDRLEADSLIAYRYWGENHDTENREKNYVAISYFLKDLNNSTRVTMRQSNIKSRRLYEALEEHMCDFLLERLKVFCERTAPLS